MTYTYEHIDGKYSYKILDGETVRASGSYPDTAENIEALLEVLVSDEEVIKEREGQPE